MPKSKRTDSESRRSSCPIACALDLIGDRWTLVIIRDLFKGKTRYGEFLGQPEGITTNILADRLERLESSGLISSKAYQNNPPRYAYTLTPKGADLKSTLGSIAMWAVRNVPKAAADPSLMATLRA